MYLPAGISTFLNEMWGYYGVPVEDIFFAGMSRNETNGGKQA